MSNIVEFMFEQNPVRTTVVNEEVWFVAIDTAKVLQYANEVLPSIRKTGGYQVPTIDFNDPILMAQLLNKQTTLYLDEQAKVDQMSPKAEVYDKVMSSDGLHSMKNTANSINRKGLGRNNLMKVLREKGVINSENKPYRKYIDLGYGGEGACV